MKTGLSLPSCSWLPISANGPQSTAASRRPCKSFSSSQVDCKVKMGWFIPFTTGLITGKITTNLKLKNLDLFLKFKSVTSVQVVLSCCSTLGRHCFIRQEDWDCRKNRDFFSSFTSLYQTWSVQNLYLVIIIHPPSWSCYKYLLDHPRLSSWKN